MHPTALVDFRAPAPGVAPLRLAFGAARAVLQARTLDEVRPLLREVEALARGGAWCTGYLSYEAAPAFDRALQVQAPDVVVGPLAAFAVHDAPLDGADARAAWRSEAVAPVRWTHRPARELLARGVAHLHAAIAEGQAYQVNLTARLRGCLDGEPRDLFAALRRAQPGAYAAWMAFPWGLDLMTVSPELFFDWRDGRLLTRPMKGTAARGASAQDDAGRAQALRGSSKEQAENLMIVDLLRNDLSRLAQPHGVQVQDLFHVEAWPTVWQMTTDVLARTRDGLGLEAVFAALFPCGSVTGAPKVQAMRLIRALEAGPRGPYCGAVGVVAPGGAATFNVPIRTLWCGDTPGAGRELHCGIGSGITGDASVDGEWAEWQHKALFLERAAQPFELLETLRLETGRLVDLEGHVERLQAAASHFGFAPPDAARAALRALAARHPRGRWRVRLLADPSGAVRVAAAALEEVALPLRIALAAHPLPEAHGEFVRFKTTRREHYERHASDRAGVFDTLLWNEAGELTEFTRGNLALRLDGAWLTPDLRCGLLDGVARRRLLRAGRLREAVLRREDLARAEDIVFFNSLRGELPARWDAAAG